MNVKYYVITIHNGILSVLLTSGRQHLFSEFELHHCDVLAQQLRYVFSYPH